MKLSSAGGVSLGLLAWMAIWWGTQAVDLAVTGLLPVLVLPLTGTTSVEQALVPFANEVIFLFAGGSVIGIAIARHGLGERLLAMLLSFVGDSQWAIVASFLCVTAAISAWVSNTATAAMMLPLAAAAVSFYSSGGGDSAAHAKALPHFRCAVLLAVAYGASIGGVMTLLGSPPNAIAAEWIDGNGGTMEFLHWSSIGVPVAVAMLLSVLVIFRFAFPLRGLVHPPKSSTLHITTQPLSRGAKVTLLIFVSAVLLWVASPLIKKHLPGVHISDGIIAIAAAFALFLLPQARGSRTPLVPWPETRALPWGVFILFGGGLSLADSMQRTGVSAAIASTVGGVSGVPEFAIVGVVVTALIFASEIGSNTALTATAVPIVGAMAPGLGISPEKLVIAATLGASCAFMLPVGTPPNALVYSTGHVPQREMIRVGFMLNLCAAVVITALCSLLL